jgi:hypothetical protein
VFFYANPLFLIGIPFLINTDFFRNATRVYNKGWVYPELPTSVCMKLNTGQFILNSPCENVPVCLIFVLRYIRLISLELHEETTIMET